MDFLQSFGEYLIANPAAMIAVSLYQALWTMLGCWFSARNDDKIWFIVIALSNTMGLVEIIYLVRKTTFFKNFNING